MAKMTAETMVTEKQSPYSKGKQYKGFTIKDGTQASPVKTIETTQKVGGTIQECSNGDKGYAPQAFNYKY